MSNLFVTPFRVRFGGLAAGALAVLWLAGAGAGPALAGGTPVTFLGDVKGPPKRAKVALVVKGGQCIAYLCSDDGVFNDNFSAWIRTEVKDGKFRGERDGVVLEGTIKNKQARGKVTGKDKDVRTFSAAQLPPGSPQGLVRAEARARGQDGTCGWILFFEGGDLKGVGNVAVRTKGGGLRNFLQKLIGGLRKIGPTLKAIAPALNAVVPGLGGAVVTGVSVAEQFADFAEPLLNRAPISGPPGKASGATKGAAPAKTAGS